MCRLLAQVSAEPRDARDLLVESEFSLLRQSDADPENRQEDGWGLAWFEEDGPRVVKSGGSARAEEARFRDAAAKARSRVVIGHLRAASNPHLDADHAHPFRDEGWVFAHNGTLTIREEVAAELGSRRARLKTLSDSEVYFQQFLKHLDRLGEPSRAFEACVLEDWELWESCRGRYPAAESPYTGLNAVASDGRGAHALCHAAARGLAECGVCHPGQPWSVMSLAERPGRAVLASEGLDRGPWAPLAPPETASLLPEGGRVRVLRRALDLRGAGRPVPEASRP